MKKHFTLYMTLFLMVIFTLPAFAESTTTAATAAQTGGTVIISVEAFTVGYGFIKQPTEISYVPGDTLFSVIEKTLGKENVNYNQDLGKELISVAVNSALAEVVDEIKEELDEREEFYTDKIAETGWLSQYDFTSSSGWLATVNNAAVKTPLNETAPTDGSVVRVQFSVYGNGADINQPAGAFSTTTGTTPTPVIFPAVNRDEAYKNMVQYMKGSVLDISESLMDIITDITSTQAEITKAAADLIEAVVTTGPNDYDELEDDSDTESTTAAEETTTASGDTDTDNRPVETDPPATQKPIETEKPQTSDLPYIPDDGKGSGNLPKEDSAPTGVGFTYSLVIFGISGAVLSILTVISRTKKKK